MAFTKITNADVANKGVIGLPDTPNMGTTEIQQKFDELALDVLMPKHNSLIDELEAGTAGASIGVKDGETDTTLQARLDGIAAGGYTKSEADEKFLTLTGAEETYLSQEDASDTYLTQTDASDTYLSQTSAEDTYLSQSDASDTYLSKTDASSDYLTKTDASSTYLTQDDASGTYLPKEYGITDIEAATAPSDGRIRLTVTRGLTEFPVDAPVKGWKEFYSPETGLTTDFTDNNTIIPIKEGNYPVTNIPYTNFRDKLKTYFDGIYGKIKNAFRTIKVGSTYIDASGGDTIEFIAGSNVTLTPDGTNKTVTIASTGGGGASSADDVSYDNTTSGLTATNVQDAIDEVYGDMPAEPTVYEQTLVAGNTSVVFSNVTTTSSSIVDVGTSVAGLDYNNISVSGTTYTVTYDAQASNVTIYLIVTET